LTELAEICTAAVFIERGKILRAGTLEQLLQSDVKHRTVVIRVLGSMDALHKHLIVQPGIESVRPLDNSVEVEVDGDERDCCRLLADLVTGGFRVLEFRPREANLEDVFMSVTRGDVQ